MVPESLQMEKLKQEAFPPRYVFANVLRPASRPRARLLQITAVLFGVFFLAVVYVAYTYDVSWTEAAQFLGRQLERRTIEAGVRLYDPCETRLAPLGPGAEEKSPPECAVRAEEYFQEIEKRAGRWDGRLRRVKVEDETIRRSPFRFYYQPHDEPRLGQLRKKYRLDEVVAGATCEFEQMVRLRSWCRSQFRRKDYQPCTNNFDALEILDQNLRNDSEEPRNPRKEIDPCIFFSMLYCQTMLSMGHTARLMSIRHGMTEVWSNQYKKWVAMDAELDWHYEKDGIPLSMAEVRDENFIRNPSTVHIVPGNQSSGDESTTMVHLNVKELSVREMIEHHLRDFAIADMRNDWLTNHYFPGHPKQSDANTLTFEDLRLGPEKNIWKRSLPHSSNREDLYWTLNQTEIWIRESSSADRLDLVLRTVTPNFDYFEIRIDDATPIHSSCELFSWLPHDGENALSVVAVNQFGVRGIPSTIKFVRDRFAPCQTTESGTTRSRRP
jgi:hypothetical protein